MTEFTNDENEIDPVNPQTEEVLQPTSRAAAAIPLLLDLFRWTTPHEIQSSFQSFIQQLFPESKMAYFIKDSSGAFQPEVNISSQGLSKNYSLDSVKDRLKPEARVFSVDDLRVEPGFSPFFKSTSSSILLGQFDEQELNAVLLIEHPQPGFFSKEDGNLIDYLVEAYSLAIKRAHHLESLTQKATRQAQFVESIAQLYQQETSKDVYQSFLNLVCKALNIPHAELEISAEANQTENEKMKEMES